MARPNRRENSAPFQRLQNPLTPVFKHPDDVVEATLPAIVGIRHAQVVMMAAEADEWADFGMQCAGFVQSLHIGQVRLVHRHDQVEGGEILRLDLPGASLDGESLLPEGIRHARIGRRALMMVDGACGIDFEFFRPPGVRHLLAKNDLGGRRAADVTKADEEDAVAWICGWHGSLRIQFGRNRASDNVNPAGGDWKNSRISKKHCNHRRIGGF